MAWSPFQKELASKTRKLNQLLPEVMEITGYKESSNIYELLQYIQRYEVVRDYAFTFLERTYMRNYTALSKKRPKVEEATMWIGQENATYGILVTPRFSNGNWENDVSEIRHFKKKYWTIGHVLETGLVVPFENEKIEFPDIEQYLKFFKNVLVRGSGSQYELEIASKYCDLVRNSDEPEEIPLLIPEFRYGGLARKHEYRLDFTIIDPNTLNKYGFELSPWSTHGYLSGTKGKLQKEINAIALGNFEKEMKKLKDYFREFEIYALIYTDSDLANIETVFSDMKKYLNPFETQEQLKLHVLDDFLSYS
ncbi:hypothetical protein COJ96_09140 [Bacillus sp. AFS073361]|uniref:hypothetical protein n=1 Tax=Bacillus sp. AFS073361 TaxID=2033511 RepID=UPI000BF885F0|nr:hypothetical protein [Bacillus sp. AFS073361]PFP29838.1 hypothetical protein COJ96_09140 [Bacillus sp. AFS073361]